VQGILKEGSDGRLGKFKERLGDREMKKERRRRNRRDNLKRLKKKKQKRNRTETERGNS
jgi:hypothetical protein